LDDIITESNKKHYVLPTQAEKAEKLEELAVPKVQNLQIYSLSS
jgi:hypothetical protein